MAVARVFGVQNGRRENFNDSEDCVLFNRREKID